MQVENILSLLGIISVAGSYVVLLLGVGVMDAESGRSFYLVGGMLGMGLVGFSKLIRTQSLLQKQLEDLVKLTRVQVRHLDEMRKAALGELPPILMPEVKPTPEVKAAPKVTPAAVKPPVKPLPKPANKPASV